MLQNLRRSVATAAASLVLLIAPMVAVPAMAYAATNTDINNQLDCGSNIDVSGTASCNNSVSTGGNNVSSLIRTIINIFSAVIGAISVIMIIFGGMQYVTSGGDSGKISNAKNTIIYALVGLVVVAMAQFLVQFVLNRVTSIGG